MNQVHRRICEWRKEILIRTSAAEAGLWETKREISSKTDFEYHCMLTGGTAWGAKTENIAVQRQDLELADRSGKERSEEATATCTIVN